ncbi:hypothetical protein MIV064L [Invertebrate iridescent virus 3]|uniref:Uncharacterized protein 064L n=1 Tax=Invertebrate iridescent virus 3 TaxID=345201 RepID=064L_IIV3|nr:hypothetical protein MIV064L [Invertebrate iridescent virus 3]Q196Z6.1 RecName: Full=Uncharacterized protein 064L [Invertebrate iridescent virus 3]ABF82094.1 hypothetical protein MIV064L [Invertebrate iridescent virus 3]
MDAVKHPVSSLAPHRLGKGFYFMVNSKQIIKKFYNKSFLECSATQETSTTPHDRDNMDQAKLCSLVFEIFKKQTRLLAHLVLEEAIDLNNDLLFAVIYFNDEAILNSLVRHLYKYKPYYCDFTVRAQELDLVVHLDLGHCIDRLKSFIDPDTACFVLCSNLSQLTGLNCLKRVLKHKIIQKSYHLYLLLKTSHKVQQQWPDPVHVVEKYVTKRMVSYALTDNNPLLLAIVLDRLLVKLPTDDFAPLIVGIIESNRFKVECLPTLLQYHNRVKTTTKPIRI